MKKLWVLYDERCAFCCQCRDWLARQPKHFPLECLARGHPTTLRHFPSVAAETDELIVISDEGGVYRGDAAWLMCLFALTRYRCWSHRLATPALRPLVRRFYAAVSTRRYALSRMLRLDAPARELRDIIESAVPPECVLGPRNPPTERG